MLRVAEVGKSYRLRAGGSARDAFWAVRGISFSLARGETLGLIGCNGAGKSTLLGILAGTIRQTCGSVVADGQVASLLDLGPGFHPLETGRENAATMLALYARRSRGEVRARMPEIERFAGLGDRFDDPIRTYSDGMRLRLGFAVVSVLEPEILLTDEVLAVGDEEFQRRCEGWFDRFLGGGGTFVLCSHDLSRIGRLCQRTLWLDGGRVREFGETREVVRHYREAMGEPGAGRREGGDPAGVAHAAGTYSGRSFEVTALRLVDDAGRDCERIRHGDSLGAIIDLTAPSGRPHVFVGITTADLTPVYGVASDMDAAPLESLGGSAYRFRIRFPHLPLLEGGYRLRAHALDETGTRLYDTVELLFQVEDAPGIGRGLVRLASSFRADTGA
ncbi:MAG: ATP-binding cassette domain-containing protein [Deltaproteobacteria bacterium]